MRTPPLWLARGVVALSVLAAVGVAVAEKYSPTVVPGASTAAVGGVRSVDVPVDRPTQVHINPWWTVDIPAGGVSTSSRLTVEPLADDVGPVGGTPLAAARLRLSSGQPTAPWTFTWRQNDPLPQDQVLYLLDDSGDGAAYGVPQRAGTLEKSVNPAAVRIATMSADRRSGFVSVSHLSFKQWVTDVAGAALNAIGGFFGHRASAPTCDGGRPEWLSDAVFLDDQNAPMRVCVGTDPADQDIAVVKVANNRGGALLVTAPAIPTWSWQSVVGAETESWMPNLLTHAVVSLGVPSADSGRNWIVPPGQQVHLGFARSTVDRLPVPVEITGSVTPTTIAVGLVSAAVSDVLDQDSRGWDFVLVAACLQSVGARAWDDHGAAGLAEAVAGLARCVVEQPETLIAGLRAALPAPVWQSRSGSIYRAANTAKRALSRYLIIGEVAFAVGDIVGTLSLPRSAFTVSLYPSTSASAADAIPFVGHWAVHGSQLDIKEDGTGLLVWNAGPCTSSMSETRQCGGNATIAFTAGPDETLLGIIVEVWYTTDNEPVTDYEYADSGYLTGETFTLARNDEHTLISSGGGPDDPDGPGNPYLCDEYAMQHNDSTYDLCGA